MKHKILLAVLLVFALRSFACDPGNAKCRKNEIVGGVTHASTKKPLSHVLITAYSSLKKEKAVLTDGNGNYDFSDLKPGSYKLVFEKTGFRSITKDRIWIRSDEACYINVEMEEAGEDFRIVPGQIILTE